MLSEKKSLQRKIDRDKRKGVFNPDLDSKMKALKALKVTKEPSLSDKGKDIPYVNFSKSGDLKSKDILRAIPVFMVNQWIENKRKSDVRKVDEELQANKEISNKEIRKKFGIGLFQGLLGETKKRRIEMSANRSNLEKERESIINDLDSSMPVIRLGGSGSLKDLKDSITRAVPVFVVNSLTTGKVVPDKDRKETEFKKSTPKKGLLTRINEKIPEGVKDFGAGLASYAGDGVKAAGRGIKSMGKDILAGGKEMAKQGLFMIDNAAFRVVRSLKARARKKFDRKVEAFYNVFENFRTAYRSAFPEFARRKARIADSDETLLKFANQQLEKRVKDEYIIS